MRKLLTLTAIAIFSFASYAQDGPKVALFEKAKSLDKAKEMGVYEFYLSSDSYTQEEVEELAGHYEKYFTVSVSQDSKDLKVQLDYVDGNEWSAKVFKRFMIALQLNNISVEGNDMEVEPFFEQYVL